MMTHLNKKANTWIRGIIQIAFFLFVFTIALSNFLDSRGINLPLLTPKNFHATCPFGAVETFGRLILDGNFISKIHESNLWIFSGVMLITITFGSVFCSYLCPLGSFQEWTGKIGKNIFKKKYNRFISNKFDHLSGYIRYVVLFMIMIFTTLRLSLVFQHVDPYYALFHFWMGDVFFTALIVLGAVTILSLFFERPWCRWFCPFGALQGIIQLISPWKIRRNKELCVSCGICTKSCPMRINIHEKACILDTRCNRCSTCFIVCPIKGAITHSLPKKPFLALKNNLITGILILSLFSAPIIFAKAKGLFITSNKPVIADSKLNSQEVKGSMTLNDLSKGFNINTGTIKNILEIPDETPDSTKIYDLEDINDLMTTNNVKLKLSEFMFKNQ